MFGNVRLVFETILENVRKSSENDQKRRYQYVYIIKRAISHSWQEQYLSILFLPLEHKIHIFSPPCNILRRSLISPNINDRSTDNNILIPNLNFTYAKQTYVPYRSQILPLPRLEDSFPGLWGCQKCQPP